MNHSLVCCAPARPILLLLGLLGLMLSCSVLAQPLTYLVGAGSVPNQCDHNSLQQAINAAASHPGEDFIRVANDQSYNTQALSIGQQDLTITGGYANCGAALPPEALPTGNTILDGGGGAAAPVISITGSGVRVLSSLQIRNGDNVQFNGSGCGGGIRFNGRGELLLRNVGISQNDANSGGGVCFTGTDSPSALNVEGDVAINNNEATTGNGGGIAITGAARLFVLRDRTSIAFNRALSGHGGGIYMQAPARADIGSPGYNGLGVLYANEASHGGGVAGYAPEDSGNGHACLRFFSTDASRPVRIQNNRATNAGGGMYLRSDAGGLDSFYTIEGRAYDFRIDGNTAPNGPAIFLDGDDTVFFNFNYGSSMVLNDRSRFYDDCNEPLNALGRVACTNKSECNRIENNRAVDINGQPTNGNVIELQDDSSLYGQTLTIQGNTGARLLSWSAGDYGYIRLNHCALLNNTLTQEVFRGFNDGVFEIQDCTIAGNAIGNTHLLRHDDSASYNTLESVLIDQPGKFTLAHPNVSSLNFNITNLWVVATDISSLRPDPTLLAFQGSGGRFVDPERGDFRLRIGAEALDFAPAPSPPVANDLDLDGRSRNFDQGDVSANTRARDVGAYERQINDRWLPNGDFVSDLRLWSNPDPAHSVWNSAFNAPASVGGSVFFSVPFDQVGATERRTALTHCFNVPSAGEYQITGQALAPGGTLLTRDYPILNWVVRYNSGDCSGTDSASGNAFFGRSSTIWQPLTAPLFIIIDPAQWTWNTTIEVRLDAAQNPGSPLATSLSARFDEIEIGKRSNVMFADSFEALTR